MIEEIIPGNKTRFNIVKAIYENPDINLSSLIRKVRASPNLVLDYTNKLSSYGVISEKNIGGKKKIHIKNLRPNFNTSIGKLIYSVMEIDKRILFFEKYKKLKPYFEQLNNIIRDKTDFVIIYGSYSRYSATKESDIDLLIVVDFSNEDVKRIKEVFVSLDVEPSLKIEKFSNFLSNRDKPLYKNIIREHIIISGEFKFISILEE